MASTAVTGYKSTSLICKGCWQHMRVPIPLRGPASLPFRIFGIRPSQMNPDLCTMCEKNFTRIKKRKQINVRATIMFADLRGYTSLSEELESSQTADMLHTFYDQCAASIWEREGIINKFIGDAALAIFNFPIMRKDHVRQSVLSAIALQRACAQKKELMIHDSGNRDATSVGIGIGIHTGETSIGELGTAYRDFTAIGPVVNLASRIQELAQPGEILITEDVYGQIEDLFPESPKRVCEPKGLTAPVTTRVLASSNQPSI